MVINFIDRKKTNNVPYEIPSDDSKKRSVGHLLGIRLASEAEFHGLDPNVMYTIGAIGYLYMNPALSSFIAETVRNNRPSQYPDIMGFFSELSDFMHDSFSIERYIHDHGDPSPMLHLYLDVSMRFSSTGELIPYDNCQFRQRDIFLTHTYCYSAVTYSRNIEWLRRHQEFNA